MALHVAERVLGILLIVCLTVFLVSTGPLWQLVGVGGMARLAVSSLQSGVMTAIAISAIILWLVAGWAAIRRGFQARRWATLMAGALAAFALCWVSAGGGATLHTALEARLLLSYAAAFLAACALALISRRRRRRRARSTIYPKEERHM